jgi:hypothetical protein
VGSEFYRDVATAISDAESHIVELQRAVERLKATQLTVAQRDSLAREVFTARLDGVKNLTKINIEASMVPLRSEDAGLGLWENLNIIQEKILRGGIEYTHLKERKDDQGAVIELNASHKTTKPVFNAKLIMGLNQLAFDKALGYATAS